MTGELDLELIHGHYNLNSGDSESDVYEGKLNNHLAAKFVFVLFMVLMAVVINNLLVGLAVFVFCGRHIGARLAGSAMRVSEHWHYGVVEQISTRVAVLGFAKSEGVKTYTARRGATKCCTDAERADRRNDRSESIASWPC